MSVEIPGYKILRTLGRGGMATVYLAIQEVFEREVALKVMSKALAEDPNFAQRFFREAKIVSKLVHPNIVTVHDVGMHDGHCYLSMEYIDGKDLKHIAHRLSLKQKICVIRDIAKALVYSGSKGYVHRDIKPENIMFHSSDGRAVLMDFGIARAAESETTVTQTGTAIGTPHYMSPEQAKGKMVDSRSDIYSLGVVFYYILAGRVPFDAESAVAIGIKHITEPVPDLPKAYAGLQTIVSRMMAKEVDKRYQDAKELMEDIDLLDMDLIEHAVEIARHSSSVYKAMADEEAPTISHADDINAEAFEMDETYVTDVGTYMDYGVDEEDLVVDKNPILPWFLAGTFVIVVVMVFVYFKNPEMVQPWIGKVLAQKEKILDKVQSPQDAEPVEVVVVGSNLDSVGSVIGNGPIDAKAEDASVQVMAVDTRLREEIDVLQSRLNDLNKFYSTDSHYLDELVSSYRALMSIAPEGHSVFAEFEGFKRNEFSQVYAQAKSSGASSALDKRINQLRSLFPEEDEKVYKKIATFAKTRKKVMTLILEAEAYLNQNNLTKPPGRNALESYEKALSLEAKNPEALAGKKQISKKVTGLAVKRYEENRLKVAKEMANLALSIDPDNREARDLKKEMNAVLTKQLEIAQRLNSATAKIKREQLFTPAKQGAFHDYQAVLALDPNNSRAREGLEKTVDAFSAKVWQLVGDEQFLQANELTRVSMNEYGHNPRVASLAQAVDEVIGEEIFDVHPTIDGMKVNGKPIDTTTGELTDAFEADRSIFLGFRYENFQTATTVIQAILMDGARQVQIAQVPVIVEGTRGESTFRIDRPVEGFPAGSYSIEMRLGREILNSMVFKVK